MKKTNLTQYLDCVFEKRKKQANLILKNPTFIKKIQEIRKKWNVPLKGFDNNEDSKKWHYWLYRKDDDKPNKSIVNDFYKDLETLRKKCNLSEIWKDFIKYYLFFNKVGSLQAKVNIVHKTNREKNEKELYIRIYGDTRIEDIKAIWSEIKEHQKLLKDYKGLSRIPSEKILERDLFIIDLYRKGLSIQEIVYKVKDKFIKSNATIKDEDLYLIEEGTAKLVISRMKRNIQ